MRTGAPTTGHTATSALAVGSSKGCRDDKVPDNPVGCSRDILVGGDLGDVSVKTVEEVDRAEGLPRSTDKLRPNSSGCTFNPFEEDDPGKDCNMPSRWHVKCRSEQEGGWVSMMACDRHIGNLLGAPYGETVVDRHEMTHACGLPDTWWINTEDGTGSFCLTTERGVELGYLVYDQG